MDRSKIFEELDALFKESAKFVKDHYKTADERDSNIKVLATMNQAIELAKVQVQEVQLENAMNLQKMMMPPRPPGESRLKTN